MAVVDNFDRVPMGEPSHGLDLALESPAVRGIDGNLGTNQLDGVGPIQQAVLGQIHLAHAPCRKPVLDAVLPQPPRLEGLLM